jgi:hypothetical protein
MRAHRTTGRLLGGLAVAVAGTILLAPVAMAAEGQPPTTPAPVPPISAKPSPGPASATPWATAAPAPTPRQRPAVPAPAPPRQVDRVPAGAPQTGGGADALDADQAGSALLLGGIALVGAAGAAGTLAARRAHRG